MSQMILAEHKSSTNWGDRKSHKSNKSNQMLVFEERGITGVLGEKPLGAEYKTNKLSPRMMPGAGIEPEAHWWKASALTAAPTLLP